MTKAKRNTVVGFRTAWSMYNDNTWRKSNRFGAISIVVAGVLTIITAAFANGITSTILLLVYLLSATIIAILYSKRSMTKKKRSLRLHLYGRMIIYENKRLVLRKWTEADAESLYEYAKDSEVGPIAGWPPHKSVEESLDVIRNVFNGPECYAICEKREWESNRCH